MSVAFLIGHFIWENWCCELLLRILGIYVFECNSSASLSTKCNDYFLNFVRCKNKDDDCLLIWTCQFVYVFKDQITLPSQIYVSFLNKIVLKIKTKYLFRQTFWSRYWYFFPIQMFFLFISNLMYPKSAWHYYVV